MKHESRRATARRAGVARARMLVKAHLGWLDGFPARALIGGRESDGRDEGVVGWVIPAARKREAETRVVTRANLSEATRARFELLRDYGAVLARVVDEPTPWALGVEAVLDALKPVVHEGAPLPAAEGVLAHCYAARSVRRAREVARGSPRVAALVDALLWSHATKPRALDVVLDALADVAAVIDALPAHESIGGEDRVRRTALSLVLLAATEGTPRVRPLVEMLGDPQIYRVATVADDFSLRLAKRLTAKNAAGPIGAPLAGPTPTLGPALYDFSDWLVTHDAPARALHRFASLAPSLSVDAWARWWKRASAAERAARRLFARPHADPTRARSLDALRDRVARITQECPAPLTAAGMFAMTRWYASEADPSYDRLATEALRALAAGAGTHALAFLEHWQTLYRVDKAAAARVLRGFTRYLRETEPLGEGRLTPWAALTATANKTNAKYRYSFERLLVDEATSAPIVAAFYRALALYIRSSEGAVDADDVEWVAELARGTFAPEVVASVAHVVCPALASLRYFPPAVVREVVRLTRGDPAAVEVLLRALVVVEERDEEAAVALEALRPFFAIGGNALPTALVVDGALPRLVECGRTLALRRKAARDAEADADVEPEGQRSTTVTAARAAPAWARAYPEGLHDALAQLDAADEGAEAKARALLHDAFPSDEGLREELAEAERRAVDLGGVARERLVKRVSNLRARLGGERRVSAARLDRLRAKVERAARASLVARLERDAEAVYVTFLRSLFGEHDAPPWAHPRDGRRLLLPIAGMRPGLRALATRLLRVRCGPPPWDLRDDPANRAFVDEIRRRGVDPGPWIDGVGRTKVAREGRGELTLWLEDDPLRVFEMGAHFGTCLSPGKCNYFSVFANAADVNKRVLYAADEKGRIVGRCLLALTTEGIVTFHPYAHDVSGFAEIVRGFVASLARAMGTRALARGNVPRLVAPDWYDDGPVDLGDRFEAFRDGSPLRTSLATVPPGRLVAELEAALDPLPLDARTLPMVFELPELRARPELAVALFPAVAAHDDVPGATLVAAARAVAAAGNAGAVGRRLLERIEAHCRARHRLCGGVDFDAAALLVDLDPARVLALLRATRAQGVRRDRDETDAQRLTLGARAAERLHRPAQALALYLRGAAAPGDPRARRECAQRIEALRRERAMT